MSRVSRAAGDNGNRFTDIPVVAVGAVVILVGFMTLLILGLGVSGRLDANSTPFLVTLLGLVGSTVPGLLAAGFAERASRDIRDGAVKESLTVALEETGLSPVDNIREIVEQALLEYEKRPPRAPNTRKGDKI